MVRHFRQSGFVTLNNEQRVCIGPRLIWLSFRVLDGFAIRNVARPHLQALARETGENVYLWVVSNLDLVLVESLEGANEVRLNIALGAARPLHATAAGKIFLAFGARRLFLDYVAARELTRFTPNTITTAKRLDEELAVVRRKRFATSDGEVFEGVCSYAVPVMDGQSVVAAISVLGLRAIALKKREFLIGKMRACKDSIESALLAPSELAPRNTTKPMRRRVSRGDKSGVRLA
jgi:DNA-binding IclR family transcriptional regulator